MSRNDEGDARPILHDDTARRPSGSTADSGTGDARESRLNTSESSTFEAALAYVELGLRVLPVHSIGPYRRCTCGDKRCRSKGKHPRTLNGVHDATSDEQTVRAWWSTWPDANVAIATGRGLLVVDVDDHDRAGYWSWCQVGPHHLGFPRSAADQGGVDRQRRARLLRGEPALSMPARTFARHRYGWSTAK